MPRKPKPRVLTKQVHFFTDARQFEDLRLLARHAEVEMSYLLRSAVAEYLDRNKPVLDEAKKDRAGKIKTAGANPYIRRIVEGFVNRRQPRERKR
jgi:hypothetical protein